MLKADVVKSIYRGSIRDLRLLCQEHNLSNGELVKYGAMIGSHGDVATCPQHSDRYRNAVYLALSEKLKHYQHLSNKLQQQRAAQARHKEHLAERMSLQCRCVLEPFKPEPLTEVLRKFSVEFTLERDEYGFALTAMMKDSSSVKWWKELVRITETDLKMAEAKRNTKLYLDEYGRTCEMELSGLDTLVDLYGYRMFQSLMIQSQKS